MKKYKGYGYLVLQMPSGHMCGYIKLPKNHPYYGKDYNDMNIDCYGGLTYARLHDGSPDIRVHKKNDYSKYFGIGFWIGFDYAHLGDWSFYMTNNNFNEKYNTITQPFEVEEECKNVINQLLKLSANKDEEK